MEITNIILIGFMGTGKSSIGKRLAKLIDWEFIDTDWEIEETTGLSVLEMFRKHGEVRFRSEEALVVRRLEEKAHCVIATGGGTILNPENWEIIKNMGLVICLYASLDTILERVSNRNDRPLLKRSREEIEELWSSRQAFYNQAQIIIDTTDQDIDGVLEDVIKKIKEEGFELNELAED